MKNYTMRQLLIMKFLKELHAENQSWTNQDLVELLEKKGLLKKGLSSRSTNNSVNKTFQLVIRDVEASVGCKIEKFIERDLTNRLGRPNFHYRFVENNNE